MVNNNPKISAFLPVYNGQDHLAECIESILNQSFKDFEFIIIDDASTDHTPTILEDFTKKDKRINVITHEKNQKQTAAANTAINSAKGNYLARIDADDVALPKRFEKQFAFLEENTNYGMVGSWTDTINENGDILGQWKTAEEDGMLKWNLLFGTSFAHASVMMRTDIVKKVGLYQSPEAEDFDLWSRISRISKVANIPEVLQQKRVWSGQLALKVPQETRDCVIQIMSKNISYLLEDSEYSLEFVRMIRSVSDLSPIIDKNNNIVRVQNTLNSLFIHHLRKNELTKGEIKKISKDLFRKLKTLTDWQLKINTQKGLQSKIRLFFRFPSFYTYSMYKNTFNN